MIVTQSDSPRGNDLALDDLVAVVRSICDSAAGLSADGPRRDDYLDLLAGQGERPDTREGMGGMSSCALFARAVLRCLGADHAAIVPPYAVGMAVADVIAAGRTWHAWVPASAQARPWPGACCIIGDAHWGEAEHVLVVRELAGDVVRSTDGGQGAGGRSIAHRERRLVVDGARLRVADATTGAVGRHVLGWLDLGLALGAGAFPHPISSPWAVHDANPPTTPTGQAPDA